MAQYRQPALVAEIALHPKDRLTFLVTKFGKPFTAAGFGGWFRERCDEAGLPHCKSHGLRKSAAVHHALNGATAPEMGVVWLAHDWRGTALHRGSEPHQARVPVRGSFRERSSG